MNYNKIFETSININNPIDFCIDKENNLLLELTKKFAGKCYKGSYIIKILEILETSSCKIIKTNLYGNCYIDVRFLANVSIISGGSILIGVDIISNEDIIRGLYSSISNDEYKTHAIVNIITNRYSNNIKNKNISNENQKLIKML